MCKTVVSLLFLTTWTVQGFVVPQCNPSVVFAVPSSLNAAKGFGDAPKTKKSKKSSSSNTNNPPQVVNTNDDVEIETGPTDANPFPENTQVSEMSEGKLALERMKRQRAEQRNEELRRVREVQETDALLRESPGAAVIPEKVAQRMGARMLPFVGIPLLGGMGAFVGFWYMATYRDMEFQPALVAATTIGMLAIGLVGITYSVMSASWDEDREGTVLGTEEFSRNLDNIKEGLTRSRENARIRDKMSEYTPEEMAEMERNEAAKAKRRQSFYEKFGKDLD